MDNQDYLNQITAASQPVMKPADSNKSGLSGILHSKYFLIAMIGIVAFVLILILGSLLGSGKSNTKTDLVKLRLHVDSTSELISTYQPNVKSSSLRSYSASLQTVLRSTSSDVSGYLTDKYAYKESKDDKNLAAQAATERDAINQELFEAKINGILDRTYAHKMAYEISMIMSEESKIYNSTKDEALITILNQSYSSLENLYNSFNDFSETK